jgi:hypothetical protein
MLVTISTHMGIVAPRIADRTSQVDDRIAVVMRIVRGLAWLGLVLALAAAAGSYAGVVEEDRLLDALVRGSLAGVERSDTTAVVLALAHAIHERTNRGVRAADLPLVERLESTSPFNMTAAVCLKHGVFGVIGPRCGRATPTTRTASTGRVTCAGRSCRRPCRPPRAPCSASGVTASWTRRASMTGRGRCCAARRS